MIEEFKELHKESEQLKGSGMSANDIKKVYKLYLFIFIHSPIYPSISSCDHKFMCYPNRYTVSFFFFQNYLPYFHTYLSKNIAVVFIFKLKSLECIFIGYLVNGRRTRTIEEENRTSSKKSEWKELFTISNYLKGQYIWQGIRKSCP